MTRKTARERYSHNRVRRCPATVRQQRARIVRANQREKRTMTITQFVNNMSAEGYDLQVTTTGRVYLANAAPDSAGASTEPGSDWDEECDSILADVAAIAEKYDWSAEWSDDDIVFTSEAF